MCAGVSTVMGLAGDIIFCVLCMCVCFQPQHIVCVCVCVCVRVRGCVCACVCFQHGITHSVGIYVLVFRVVGCR